MPYERTNAVMSTEQFLLELCDSKKTPRVPGDIRRMARSLLRHYPSKFDMEIISKRENGIDNTLSYQVFGENKFRNDK